MRRHLGLCAKVLLLLMKNMRPEEPWETRDLDHDERTGRIREGLPKKH